MERIETTILRNLVFNEEYSRKVIPFIQPDYFEQRTEKIIFEEITQFIVKYGNAITTEALAIELENRTDLSEMEVKEMREITSSLTDAPADNQWLEDTTEKWCRDRAIYLALMESVTIADGGHKEKNRDAIPSILSDALAVSFDNHIGHNYLEDYKERYESYHKKEDRIPFDLEYFNKITKGGLPNKTLNVALAGTGVGKSLFMCHMASSVLLNGRNVLYITMEMAEEKIAERIDANLLNVPIQDLVDLPRTSFENKVTNISKKTQGQLIIKEYPLPVLIVDTLRHFLMNLHLRSLLNLISYLWIISIFVPRRVTRDLPILIPILLLSRLQRNLEDWLSKPRSLSYLPPRPLVLVMVALMLTLLILLSPLVSLLLLILCLPLLARKNWNSWDRLW